MGVSGGGWRGLPCESDGGAHHEILIGSLWLELDLHCNHQEGLVPILTRDLLFLSYRKRYKDKFSSTTVRYDEYPHSVIWL